MRDEREKQELIEKLSNIDELSKLVENLLTESNLSNIVRNEDRTIFATQSGVIDSKYCYIFAIESLQGKDSNVFSIMNYLVEDTTIDAFCIVTNRDVNSKTEISNYFKEQIKRKYPTSRVSYWSKTDLIDKVNKYYPTFWQHEDTFLKPYEDFYLTTIETDSELRNLLKLDDKYQKMLNIFIEPRLSIFVEDKESQRLRPKQIKKEKLVKDGCYVIAGDAGTGKTTLLKEIGKELIDNNLRTQGKKNLPIFIKHTDLVNNNFDINDTIDSLLLKIYKSFDVSKLFDEYNIILLVDSLDELERKHQINILKDIDKLYVDSGLRFIIATRSYEYLVKDCEINEPLHITIQNFNLKQIESFLQNFFKFDELKANTLLHSLHDNRILDKLPITPLTLSVISILYEERQYEIPATITDIYDNFHLFLLGRTTVQSSLEFLDINIKERILSIYALTILQNPKREPKKQLDFIGFIENFFAKRRITVDKIHLPELVQSLTQGTGVLYVDENDLVNFKHNFFMEYYASREIFNHQRGLENELVNRFTDFNWQNTAIFYAGRTKDMPEFLERIISRLDEYDNIVDCLVSVSGMGYLLQALWLTDADKRKEGIKASLKNVIKSFTSMQKMSSEKGHFFSDLQYPTIALINALFFFKDFTSITLKDPLVLAFDDLLAQYMIMKDTNDRNKSTIMYQLFNISICLYSEKINLDDKINILFSKTDVLSDPLLFMLFDIGLDVIDPKNSRRFKKEHSFENQKRKLYQSIRYYIDTPTEKIRLTSFDTVGTIRDVEIYTEGKTDPQIIEHAYDILTDYSSRYWSIHSSGNSGLGSGAAELRKLLESIEATLKGDNSKHKTIIGIFDNDMKGNQEFNGLKKDLFFFWNDSKRIKKHKEHNIFALKLPVPDSKEHYLKEKQEFLFFSIEHYFPIDFLKSQGIVDEVKDFSDIYSIKDKKKQVFTDNIKTEKDVELFKDFKNLFEEIDYICSMNTIFSDPL